MVRKFLLSFCLVLSLLAPVVGSSEVDALSGQWSSDGSTIYYSDGNVNLMSPGGNLNMLSASSSSIPHIHFRETDTGDDWYIVHDGDNLAFRGEIASKQWLTILKNGNVGIGTVNPTKKLAVDGTVLAKEVIVSKEASYWPDYVFTKDYELMPLGDLADFVRNNRRLPGIPSAGEISEKGLSLGDMQRKQLEKIEELVLYVFAQEERINILEAKLLELSGEQ